MMVLLLLVPVVLAVAWTAVLVKVDGHGWRPAPRSHAHEASGSTWPDAAGWDR